MRLFFKLAALSLRLQFTYRTANLAGLATNFFFGLLRAAILTALYGEAAAVAGLSLRDAVTYTGLSQAVIAYLSFFGWWEIILSVYSGDVGSDLLKPMDYYTHWLARDVGRAAACFLVRGATLMLGYALVFELTFPPSAAQWLATGAAGVLALLVSFSFRFLVNLAAFWTPDARGIGHLAFTLSWFLSGFVMPLRFFPDWFVRLARLTPFPSMVTTVVEIYLGTVRGADLLLALGEQVMWIAILLAAGQVALRASVRRLVIQGG